MSPSVLRRVGCRKTQMCECVFRYPPLSRQIRVRWKDFDITSAEKIEDRVGAHTGSARIRYDELLSSLRLALRNMCVFGVSRCRVHTDV